MTWHSNQASKKTRPGIGKLAGLLLVSIMVIVAMALGTVAAAAQEPTPTPTPPQLKLRVDGKEGVEVKTYFEVSCLKPGDSGSAPIVLKNIGTDDGVVLFRITDLTDEENGINEPESSVDSTPDEGELSDNLYIWLTTDGIVIGEGFASELEGWEQFIGLLPSGSETTIEIIWSVGWDVGNIIQTDSCVFDMEFILHEALPPALELSNLVVPETGYYCEPVLITVDARNVGHSTGTFDVTLVITLDTTVVHEETVTVTLDPFKRETLHFTWHPIQGGTVYTVTVDGLSDTIEILTPLTPTPTPSPSPPPGGGGGGGGGLPPRYLLSVDMWGKVTSGDRTAFGILVEVIEAVSDDGVVTLLIRDGTEVLDLEGNPISLITVEPVEVPPPLPPGAFAIVAYDFTPPCTFDPAVEMVLLYSEEVLPEGFAEVYLVVMFYDEVSGEWREVPTVVDTFANTGSIVIGHLTVFAIVARVPELTVTGLSVSPIEVDPGEDVTVTVEVANTGASTGSRTIELWIEGEREESRDVTLDAGAAESVTFTVSREEDGVYRVAVDGFRGEFEVVSPAGFGYWPLIVGILGGLLLVGGATYLLLRWRAAERKKHAEIIGGQP